MTLNLKDPTQMFRFFITDTDTDNFIFSRNCTYQLHGYIQNES